MTSLKGFLGSSEDWVFGYIDKALAFSAHSKHKIF